MKFLLTTIGSLGDLHPYIAVGKGLVERGHSVALATSEIYRGKVEGEGIAFHPLRPDMAGIIDNPASIRLAFHPRKGTEHVIRKMILPYLEQSFEDTMAAAQGADLIVSHPLAFAVPLVTALTGQRWISVALAPALFLSIYDPPSVPGVPAADRFRGYGPGFWRAFWGLGKWAARSWGEPIDRFRRKLGLPPGAKFLMDDTLSPLATQAWFSKVMAKPQPDWPVNTTITGFPFYDRLEPGEAMPLDLRAFLDSGPPPVVFTLGSSAVFDAGTFYDESARAARLAGVRAVMLTGRRARNLLTVGPDESVFIADYAPYSELFPHAAAIVHQGGVGTTAQALRAGRPMIVVPFAHDQQDNARRVTGLGVARTVPRGKYRAETVARSLNELLKQPHANAAKRVAAEMATEDGVRTACEGLEAL